MDKRILKTKRGLKYALSEILKEKDFEKITVTEICERASTSRITFYTYYGDKYDLLEELLSDLHEKTIDRFRKLQTQNNENNDLAQGMMNLMDAMMAMSDETGQIDRKILSNPDLLLVYYRLLIDNINSIETDYLSHFTTQYPLPQLNAFLCVGLWAFLHAGRTEENRDEIDRYAHQLISDLIDSRIFSCQEPTPVL